MDWPLWSWRTTSVVDTIDDPQARAVVVDLGSVTEPLEREAASVAVLGHLWRERHAKRPTLIVIDESHNVCPAHPETPLAQLATSLTATIAAEGRKFGLHLLVATQRPSKVDANVLSQCDNLVLMRLNSAADARSIASTFSHVPEQLVLASGGFTLGQALVAGPISTPPQLIRFDGRVTPEGGGDVPLDWTVAPPLAVR